MDVIAFWNYTLGEIITTIEVYHKKVEYNQKQMLVQCYLEAKLTAEFVNKSFNGKPVPKFNDVFPGVMKEPEFDWVSYEQQFLDFANTYNRQRGALG